jgi:tetratricopeptide (TPR) repeat protein
MNPEIKLGHTIQIEVVFSSYSSFVRKVVRNWRKVTRSVEATMAETTPNQMRIFVSHSSSDNAFCGALVDALRATGADVWYDQHNLRSGQLLDTIVRELKTRPIFIVIVSEEAVTSEWVPKECRWAWGYYLRNPARLILPVVVRPVQQSYWDNFPYLDDFTRIEGPNHQPYPPQEAIERTLKFLAPPAQDALAQNETLWTLLSRGRTLLAEESYAQALPVFEQATRQSPRSYQAWFNLGYTLSELGREEEAASAYDRVVRLRPTDAAAWYGKGRSLDRAGHYDDGLVALERAIELDSTLADPWSERGRALGHLGKLQEALQSQETALSLDADDPDNWDNKGVALAHLERYKEAIEAFDKALALDPRSANAWSNKGLALNLVRRNKEALAAFDQALALDPNLAFAWQNKSAVLNDLKRYADALVTLERAIALDPTEAECWYGKARALFYLERYEESLKACEQAISLCETSGVYWAVKAMCLHELGRHDLAEQALEKAKARGYSEQRH